MPELRELEREKQGEEEGGGGGGGEEGEEKGRKGGGDRWRLQNEWEMKK